jgi:hypothetical protein
LSSRPTTIPFRVRGIAELHLEFQNAVGGGQLKRLIAVLTVLHPGFVECIDIQIVIARGERLLDRVGLRDNGALDDAAILAAKAATPATTGAAAGPPGGSEGVLEVGDLLVARVDGELDASAILHRDRHRGCLQEAGREPSANHSWGGSPPAGWCPPSGSMGVELEVALLVGLGGMVAATAGASAAGPAEATPAASFVDDGALDRLLLRVHHVAFEGDAALVLEVDADLILGLRQLELLHAGADIVGLLVDADAGRCRP